MQLLLMSAITLVMFLASITFSAQKQIDEPQVKVDAARVVGQYRLFMNVASDYMRDIGSASPGVVSIDWATMSQSAVASPGARNIQMPPGWRVIRAADLSWVACTQMDERAVSALSPIQYPVPPAAGAGAPVTLLFKTQGLSLPAALPAAPANSFVVIGDDPAAATLAAMCQL